MYRILLIIAFLSVSFKSQAQIFSDWQPGSYYDSTNAKHSGFIAKPANEKYLLYSIGSAIKFRPTMDAENQKIQAENIKSIVIGVDSFVVSHEEDLHKTPFVKVLLNKPTKLYGIAQKKYIGSKYSLLNLASNGGLSYNNNVYYTGPDADHLTKMKRGDFKKVMSELLSDNTVLVKEIKVGNFSYSEMEDLIESYKTGVIKHTTTSTEEGTEN
ncbi:hypothetical protein GCM10027037_06870 [Mucilaginibacter koreensis]